MRDHGSRRQRRAIGRIGIGELLTTCAGTFMAFHSGSARATAPLSVEALYTGEVWANLDGGIPRDTVYLDNLDIIATLDAHHIGLSGTTIGVSALYNNRNRFSEMIVGDLQTISNIDTDGSIRLYEAWIERDVGTLALKAGLIDLNSEFDVNGPGSLFINSSHGIGPDFSQVGETGPSIFPITGLGIRARLRLGPNLTVAAGLFEGTPGNPDSPRRMDFDLDDDEGALLVGEIKRSFDAKGTMILGVWHHTGGRTPPLGPGMRGGGSTGAYLLVAGRIARTGNVDIEGFARVGVADPRVHRIARYAGAGLVVSGPLLANSAASGEQLGVSVANATTGRRFQRSSAAGGQTLERRETVIELTYRIRLTENFAVQPNLQYIVNPGMNPERGNAVAAGLRFELNWRHGQ
jgi:porin